MFYHKRSQPIHYDQNRNFSSKNDKAFFHSIELKYDSICNMPIKGNTVLSRLKKDFWSGQKVS